MKKYLILYGILLILHPKPIYGQNKHHIKEIAYKRTQGTGNLDDFTFIMFLDIQKEKTFLKHDGKSKRNASSTIKSKSIKQIFRILNKVDFSHSSIQAGRQFLGMTMAYIRIVYGNNQVLEIFDYGLEKSNEFKKLTKLHRIFTSLRFKQDWEEIED